MKQSEFYGDTTNFTGDLVKNGLIIQSFIAKEQTLFSAAVNFGTYARKNWALITVEILNQNGDILKSCVENSQKFADNKYHVFKLNCRLTVGERYFLKMYTENGQLGHTITARWGYRKHVEEVFYLNDDSRRGELACYFEFDDNIDGVSETIIQSVSDDKYSKGLVSVIIPCRNSIKTIEKTLKSIKEQSYNYYELIVVDDASDDVEELEIMLEDYDCSFIKSKENKGAPATRNNGETIAKGEYLLFCDSDVTLNSNAFETMIQKLNDYPSCSWCYCNFKWGDRVLSFQPFNKAKMFEVNCSSTMSMLKHAHFPGFDESLQKLQDWDLFITMMKNGFIGIWENSVLFETIDSKTGITNNSIPELKAREILRKKHPEIKKV